MKFWAGKISNVYGPDPPTSQTDRQTDGRTYGRHAITLPRFALQWIHNQLFVYFDLLVLFLSSAALVDTGRALADGGRDLQEPPAPLPVIGVVT